MTIRNRGIVALLAVSALILPVGCSADPTTEGDNSSDSGASAIDVSRAEERLDKYRDKPEFEAPGPAFDAREVMNGKHIASIPVSSANEFTNNIEQAMSEIADDVGFKFSTWTNQGAPNEWSRGMNHFISQEPDLIDLLGGTDPRVLTPQVKAAQEAGIIVAASHTSGFDQSLPEVSAVVPIDYQEAGRLLADWTIAKTGGKNDVLVLTSDEVFGTASIVSGMNEEFDAICPDTCNVEYTNVPISSWADKIRPNVQSAIQANPDLDYVVPIYDSMAQFVVPAITAAGASDRVKIATFNGTPSILGLVQEGKVEVNIGENLDWISRAILDAEMRIIGGIPPFDESLKLDEPYDPKIPFYIFTEENADDAGSPPQLSTGYGDAYIEGYEKLWKLK